MKFSANRAALRGMMLSASAAIATMALPAHAQDEGGEEASAASPELRDTAARFGVRAEILDISLSPSGKKIAYISAGPRHTEVLNIVDLGGDAQVKSVTSNQEIIADLTWCEWATDTRLLCQIAGMGDDGGTLIPFDRLFAINDDGSEASQITERRSMRSLGFNQFGGDVVALDVEGEQGKLLITKNYIPEAAGVSRLNNSKQGMGVDLVDIDSGKRSSRERPDEKALRYVADDKGNIRIKVRALEDSLGNQTGDYVYMYRAVGQSSWDRLDNLTIEGQPLPSFVPSAVDSARNVAIGFMRVNGFDALAEVKLDGSGEGRILVARDDVDVDGLIRIGRQRRVVGASYATEKRAVEYFDPELAKLASDLNKALPNQPLIDFVGASADESRLLIVASSDTDPGMVYLFNRTTNQLEPLLPVRKYLADQALGQMKPITYPAADGTQIPGYLTLPAGSDGKNLPTIVLPHGGPAARDFWGFDWIVQFFTARGYAVLQPNYRGSAGYGEAWFGKNGYQAWDVAIGDVNDAGKWLVSQGIANKDKLAIAGWSYGGYAALQSQVVDPNLYKAVVAIAPVTDLEYLRDDARAYTSYRLRDEQFGTGPHIAAGSPRRHAEKFAAPVALFHGTRDLNVEVRHSQSMAKALRDAGKAVTYREFEDLEHSLRDSKARAQMLEDIDIFLTKALGGK